MPFRTRLQQDVSLSARIRSSRASAGIDQKRRDDIDRSESQNASTSSQYITRWDLLSISGIFIIARLHPDSQRLSGA